MFGNINFPKPPAPKAPSFFGNTGFSGIQQNSFAPTPKAPPIASIKPPTATTVQNPSSPNYGMPLKPAPAPVAASPVAPKQPVAPGTVFNPMGPVPNTAASISQRSASSLPYSGGAAAGSTYKAASPVSGAGLANASQYMPNSSGSKISDVAQYGQGPDQMIAKLLQAGVPAWQLGTVGNQVSFRPFTPGTETGATPTQRMEALPSDLQSMLDNYNKANTGKDPWSVPSSLLPGTMLSQLPQWAKQYEAALQGLNHDIPINATTTKQYEAFKTPEVQNAITAYQQHMADLQKTATSPIKQYSDPVGMTQPKFSMYPSMQGGGSYSAAPSQNPSYYFGTPDPYQGGPQGLPYPSLDQSNAASQGGFSYLPILGMK